MYQSLLSFIDWELVFNDCSWFSYQVRLSISNPNKIPNLTLMSTVTSGFMRDGNEQPRRRMKVHPDFVRKARVGELLIRTEPYKGTILAEPVNYYQVREHKDNTLHDLNFHKHKDPMWHLRYRQTAPKLVDPVWDVKNQSWRAQASANII
jgi:hypothetical protein